MWLQLAPAHRRWLRDPGPHHPENMWRGRLWTGWQQRQHPAHNTDRSAIGDLDTATWHSLVRDLWQKPKWQRTRLSRTVWQRDLRPLLAPEQRMVGTARGHWPVKLEREGPGRETLRMIRRAPV